MKNPADNDSRRRTVLLAACAVSATTVLTNGCSGASELGAAAKDELSPRDGSDLVLKGGYIYTVDNDDTVHEALAVTDGHITYVGSDKGVARHIDRRTEVVDLRGRMVMPGLHDGHLHPIDGGQGLLGYDLAYAPLTVEEFRNRIQAFADKTKNRAQRLAHGGALDTGRPCGRKEPRCPRPTWTPWPPNNPSW